MLADFGGIRRSEWACTIRIYWFVIVHGLVLLVALTLHTWYMWLKTLKTFSLTAQSWTSNERLLVSRGLVCRIWHSVSTSSSRASDLVRTIISSLLHYSVSFCVTENRNIICFYFFYLLFFLSFCHKIILYVYIALTCKHKTSSF